MCGFVVGNLGYLHFAEILVRLSIGQASVLEAESQSMMIY